MNELARETGISKPSVVRLLAILTDDGFVRRAARRGCYELTREVLLLSSGFRDDSALVRAAGPVMERLTGAIDWPTALGVFEQGEMVVRYSTIPSSPLAWYRSTLFRRLSLLGSAMGQAFLAFSHAAARSSLLQAWDDDTIAPAEKPEEFFEQVRARGFGLRAATAEHPTFSISVPLIVGDRVAACLSATIYARAMTVDDAIARYRNPLLAAADEIVRGEATLP